MAVPSLISLLDYMEFISNTSTESRSSLCRTIRNLSNSTNFPKKSNFKKVNLINHLKERVVFLHDTLTHLEIKFNNDERMEIGKKKIRVMASELEYLLKAGGVDDDLSRKMILKTYEAIAEETKILFEEIDAHDKEINILSKEIDIVVKEINILAKELEYSKFSSPVLDHVKGTFFSSSSADHKDNFLSAGLEESLMQLRNELTGSSNKLQKVGIVGMAGIGKTTLAKIIFQDPSVIQHFDLLAWIKISQFHTKTDILLQVLKCINQRRNYGIRGQTEASLEEELHRSLKGQRYLIVIDDLWSAHSWNEIRRPYSDDSMGSCILFTGREDNVIIDLRCKKIHHMTLLNEDTSWDLLQKRVFGQGACPPALIDTGKQIAKKCQGLPLAIVVISGVLLKISKTLESWKVIADTISSLVLSSTNPCQEIFTLSYKHLPAHLKSCFLYMGAFTVRGLEIESQSLVRLWIAEGFITSMDSENLEQVADGYLQDLIDRSLVITASKRSNGNVKTCRMHHLLLEFCIKQAQEDKFLNVIKDLKKEEYSGREELQSFEDLIEVPRKNISKQKIHRHPEFSFPQLYFKGIPQKPQAPAIPVTVCSPENHQRIITEMKNDRPCRFSFHYNTFEDKSPKLQALTARTTVCSFEVPDIFLSNLDLEFLVVLDMIPFRFVRFPEEQVSRLLLVKYLALTTSFELPAVVFRLLKLQTLIINDCRIRSDTTATLALPLEFWESINLRHVQLQVANYLPPPDKSFVEQMVSLRTLSKVSLSSFSTQEIFARISNVTKLGVCETMEGLDAGFLWNRFFENLVLLSQLETLKVYCLQMNTFSPRVLHIPRPNAFPENLQELTLSRSHLPWEKMKILSEFPNLEVLKLINFAFKGPKWETKGRGFKRLTYLLIENTDLSNWSLECDDCFPKLQQLVLKFCDLLEEIPEQIGNMPSLSCMELCYCSSTAEQSVKYIQELQEELGRNIKVFIRRKIIRNGSTSLQEYYG